MFLYADILFHFCISFHTAIKLFSMPYVYFHDSAFFINSITNFPFQAQIYETVIYLTSTLLPTAVLMYLYYSSASLEYTSTPCNLHTAAILYNKIYQTGLNRWQDATVINTGSHVFHEDIYATLWAHPGVIYISVIFNFNFLLYKKITKLDWTGDKIQQL